MSVASRFENASARASHTRTHAGAQQQKDRWKNNASAAHRMGDRGIQVSCS